MTHIVLTGPSDVGIAAVDDEHHLQLSLIAATRQAVAEKRSGSEVDAMLDRFVDFTNVHFASEAALMRLYQYTHYDAHVLEHDRTMEQLEAVRSDWRAGHADLTLERIDDLAECVRSHIATADRTFGRYLIRLGVGPG
jgi:hemerythrin-like metal-binding domain